jgi:hypothetical protein
MAGKHQPSKIFVFGEQNAIFAVCLLDQLTIYRPLHGFADSQHIVPFAT